MVRTETGVAQPLSITARAAINTGADTLLAVRERGAWLLSGGKDTVADDLAHNNQGWAGDTLCRGFFRQV